ncbi:recombinase family protein [Streptomyces sp. NPDC059556]|uniref:recombinase family protein n=1 Tax=Streptomyces sp. NPDC059556 TaxID=3346863 RepID=UPI00368409C1
MPDVVAITRESRAQTELQAVQQWARQHGQTVVKVMSPAPDELAKVVDTLRTEDASGAVVATLDALGDTVAQEVFRAVFEQAGGTLYVVDQDDAAELAAGTGVRQLLRDTLDRMVHLQGQAVAVRLHTGQARSREVAGRSGGRAPFGFRLVAGELVGDAREEAVRRRMRELRASGLGYSAIARRLGTEGYLKRNGGSEWHPDMVRRILIRDEDEQEAS